MAAAPAPQPSSSSSAAAVEDPELTAPHQTPDEALAADAAQFAKINNVSQDVAVRALRDGAALNSITGKLRSLIGDREVSITKQYLPTTKLVAVVSGLTKIPGLAEIVAASPLPVVLSYSDKMSIDVLHDTLLTATTAWKRAFPQIARTTIDDTNSDRILVVTDPGADGPSVSALQALAPALPKDLTISVIAQETPDPSTLLDSRGGLRVANQSGVTPQCTSGFMGTKNSSGTKVLITAAHCDNALRYIGWASTSIWTNMTFQVAADANDVDAQTHLTGGAGAGQFWTGNSYRDVTGVTLRSNLATGDFICRFGFSSGAVCGTVRSTHSTFGGIDVCNDRPCDDVWIATSVPTEGGDSGGPAYFGGSALGIVKGHYNNGTESLGVVGSVSYVRARLDVKLIGE